MNRQGDLAVSELYPPFLWAAVCKQTSALSLTACGGAARSGLSALGMEGCLPVDAAQPYLLCGS